MIGLVGTWFQWNATHLLACRNLSSYLATVENCCQGEGAKIDLVKAIFMNQLNNSSTIIWNIIFLPSEILIVRLLWLFWSDNSNISARSLFRVKKLNDIFLVVSLKCSDMIGKCWIWKSQVGFGWKSALQITGSSSKLKFACRSVPNDGNCTRFTNWTLFGREIFFLILHSITEKHKSRIIRIFSRTNLNARLSTLLAGFSDEIAKVIRFLSKLNLKILYYIGNREFNIRITAIIRTIYKLITIFLFASF